MTSPPWHQANVAFADWDLAEEAALTHLVPLLCRVQDEGVLTSWFHVRKNPCWRIRYRCGPRGHSRIGQGLDALTAYGHIAGWTQVVYEPEVHAFGGTEAMDTAHILFHADSRNLTARLQTNGGRHRRETSLLLCSLLMRSAGLDWYEQGDVWARVSAHRADPTSADAGQSPRLREAVHRLISVDAKVMVESGGPLADLADWTRAYGDAGAHLAHLNAAGQLRRGLRDTLAHHVIFAWNRIGLPYPAQVALAAAAKTVVFGPDPTTDRSAEDRVEP